MDNSLIPRAFSPTDAKREREANAREAERRSSARNASSSTIGAGGKLTLDGGGIDVIEGGAVKVMGQGMSAGAPYVVTAEVTNFVDPGQQEYKSPGMVFSSALYGNNRTFINSRDGRSIRLRTDDYTAGTFGQVSVGTGYSGIYLGTSGADVYETRVEGFQDQINAYIDRSAGSVRAGFTAEDGLTAGGEVRVGHLPRFPSTTKAQLRTQDGGKLWLESSGSAASAIVMDGAGNVDIQGTLTNNGAPISGGGGGGAVSSVAGKTGDVTLVKGDVGLGNVDNTSDANKPVSTATQAALDGKVNTGPQHAEFTLTNVTVPSGGPLASYTSTFVADTAQTTGPAFATTPAAGKIGLPAGTYAVYHFVDCKATMGTGAVVAIQNDAGTARYASLDVVSGSWNAGISHPCIYLPTATNIRLSVAQFGGANRSADVRVAIEKIK